jgi:LuxR family maltose regulon positive regulatory protein
MHWLGTARIAVDPPLARAALERSYDLALADGDDLCQIQAAAGIVQSYILQYTHFRPLDKWIDVLLLKLSERTEFPNLEAELRAQSALLIALAYRRPGHPRNAACVERVFELVQTGAEANLRLVAAASLFAYGTTTGPVPLARRALPILHALLRHPEVTALNAAWSWFIISYLHCICREFSLCREAISNVERLGRDHGLPAVFKFAAIIGAWAALFEQDVIGARKWLEWMEQTTSPSDLYDVATCHVTKGFWLLLSGDPDAMVRHYEQALPLFDEAGSIMHRSMYRIILSFALTQTGAFEEARRRIAQAWEIAGPSIPGWQAGALYASDASLALKEGDEARAVQALAAMLSTSREHGEARGFVNWFGRWMPSLCAEAMARGIEAEHVRYLIQRYGWQPPTPAPEQWPWRVKAYTLGRFELLLDDQPLAFLHKTPRKPLALLKALIAMGGVEVPEHKLIDALWPGDEGDAARKAYNITLHRLRGLLGDNAALVVEGGRVGLNAQLCWLDVWELERLLASASEHLPHGDQSGFVSEGERAAALYRGGFLPSDTDLDWTVSLRERLRGRFVQLVEGVGKRLEASAAREQAIDWYLRGLQADDLTESFYQGLMRCYQQTGQRAEALSVFRRMRQTLSVTLGIAPSGQSEALYQDLLAG